MLTLMRTNYVVGKTYQNIKIDEEFLKSISERLSRTYQEGLQLELTEDDILNVWKVNSNPFYDLLDYNDKMRQEVTRNDGTGEILGDTLYELLSDIMYNAPISDTNLDNDDYENWYWKE